MIKKIISSFLLVSFLSFTPLSFAYENPPNDNCVTVEHMKEIEGAKVNLVKVTPKRSVIQRENLLEVAFAENFNSKYYKPGDIVQFVFCQNVTTQEGTCLIPCNTSLIAKVTNIVKPKWFSRNAIVCLEFTHILLPDGTNIPLRAELANKKGYLQYGAKETTAKIAAYTLLIGGFGTGLGAAIGVAGGNVITGLIIGGSVGGGVGLLSGIVSPGLNYRAKKGKIIPIRLKKNLTVPRY